MRLTCSALIRQFGREDLVPDLVQAIIGRQYGNNGCVRELAVTGELAIIAICLDGYTRLQFKRPVVGGRNGSSAAKLFSTPQGRIYSRRSARRRKAFNRACIEMIFQAIDRLA